MYDLATIEAINVTARAVSGVSGLAERNAIDPYSIRRCIEGCELIAERIGVKTTDVIAHLSERPINPFDILGYVRVAGEDRPVAILRDGV